jgi:hypothetical protein
MSKGLQARLLVNITEPTAVVRFAIKFCHWQLYSATNADQLDTITVKPTGGTGTYTHKYDNGVTGKTNAAAVNDNKVNTNILI